MLGTPNRDIPILIGFICIIYLSKNYLPEISKAGKNCQIYEFQRKESSLAHSLLDNLQGIEIGGSLINPFCLNTINVDYTNDTSTDYKKNELRYTKGGYLHVDVVASGDKLPFKNGTYDFVISSHAIEHFIDPIKTIKEWFRVIKTNGYIFMIIPHKERTFDKIRNRTTLNELLLRHKKVYPDHIDGHHNVWITEDVLELCRNQNWKVVAWLDKDDVFGNGQHQRSPSLTQPPESSPSTTPTAATSSPSITTARPISSLTAAPTYSPNITTATTGSTTTISTTRQSGNIYNNITIIKKQAPEKPKDRCSLI